jgi:hypothetical protein
VSVSTLKPDVFAGHRLAGLGIDAGVLDAVAGVPVDLVEADLFGIGRGRIKRDWAGDERKAQEAFPVGAGAMDGNSGYDGIQDERAVLVPTPRPSSSRFILDDRCCAAGPRPAHDSYGTKREHWRMSAAPATSRLAADDLETAADQAIAASGGDAREAVKALILANNFLEARVTRLQASVSTGYARGRLDPRQPEEC